MALLVVHLLLPLNHAVFRVVEDHNHKCKAKPDCGFYLLAVHHKAAIAAYNTNFSFRMNKFCSYGSWQCNSHRAKRIVYKAGIWLISLVQSGCPYLVHSNIRDYNVRISKRFPYVIDYALRLQRKMA